MSPQLQRRTHRRLRRAVRRFLNALPPPIRRRVRPYARAGLRRVAPPPPPRKQRRVKPAPAPALASKPVAALPNTSRLELRRECVFASAKPDGLMLEIGPAHNAILPKREGFNTKTVDYLDREGLVEKYREFQQYSPDDIEEVDYVLAPGASMADVIPERFDVVLASHVLEHTTSLIDFLNECTQLLADGGVVALVVPDHRFCFDRFRQRSALSRVIDASVNPPPVHTVGTLTEFYLNAVKHRNTTSWAPGHQGKYRLIHSVDEVKANAKRADSGEYVDVHNWIFSPNHLRLLLDDLYSLGLISLRETFFHDTVGHEFFLNLSVDGAGAGLSREELLVLADVDVKVMDTPAFARPQAAAPPPS